MSTKGLDTTFVHYGIRKEDCAILEALSRKHDLEYQNHKRQLCGGTWRW